MPEPLQRPARGIALIVLMAVGFAAMDTAVRWLAGVFPVTLLLWFRYGVQAVVMAVWLGLSRRHGFRAAQPRFQVLRGALLLTTSAMIFLGLQHMPVPELTSIGMLTPLLVTLLAAWLLHERVSRLRWLLVAAGFVGALIVTRPGSGLFGAAALYPLAGACSYAAFQVLTSRMSSLDSPYTTHFYTGLTGMLAMTPLVLIHRGELWAAAQAAGGTHWAVLALVGALGTGGHLLLILALGMAPTATLMPFVYSQIPIAAGFGWLVFAQLPDATAWAGMALIMVCGAAGAWLNLRAAPAQPARPARLKVAAVD